MSKTGTAKPPYNPHEAGADHVQADAAAALAAEFGAAPPVDAGQAAVDRIRASIGVTSAGKQAMAAEYGMPARQVSLFASMVADADTVDGATLEKDKAQLCGVPFVITAATFRDGVERNTNYVSLDLVVADKATLAFMLSKNRIDPVQAAQIIPDEQLVINDGSTGICRQVVSYLHHKGLIELPEGPDNGLAGASRFDTYWQQWAPAATRIGPAEGDTVDRAAEFKGLRLYCPRGLRMSEYEFGKNGEAITFYLG